MNNKFLPILPPADLRQMLNEGKIDEVFEKFAEPLHEGLVAHQSFTFLDELLMPQQAVIAFDYIQQQVAQGGFIQLIQNGYISLLVTVIEALQTIDAQQPMILILDNVLKVYVLNRETLDAETSVEQFAKLYDEFKEFEQLESDFIAAAPVAKKVMIEACLQLI